jgi:UDP-N-acetylglucosamine transferase subunit ALG13
MERFGLTKMDAIDRYTEYIDEHQQIHGKLVDNGFSIVMSVIPMEEALVINVF